MQEAGAAPQSARWGCTPAYKAAAVCLAAAAGLAVLFLYDPAATTVYPPCPFHYLTGLHCPGCGTLRAIHQLLHGNLLAAVRLNPLMVACLPILGCALASRMVSLVSGRPWPRRIVPAVWIWTLLAIVVAFWILRNIPAYPFYYLAP